MWREACRLQSSSLDSTAFHELTRNKKADIAKRFRNPASMMHKTRANPLLGQRKLPTGAEGCAGHCGTLTP